MTTPPHHPTRSPYLEGLRCIQCDERHPVADRPRGCPSCAARGRNSNLFCVYADAAPADQRYPYLEVPALGQGETPMLPVDGQPNVWVKNEAANPTGSHKDRFSAFATAHARACGYRGVVIGSSGNAGLSMAAYAAAAGLRCTVAGFDSLPDRVRSYLTGFGAEVRTFATDRERVALVEELAAAPDTLAVSNITHPVVGSSCFGIEGYKRISWEIADRAPEPVRHVILPSSRGDLAWGVHRGFAEVAEQRGLPVPRLHLVEPYPRLSAVLDGASLTDRFPGDFGRLSSIAGDGTTVQAHRAVTRSKGSAVVVSDAVADEWFSRLCRRGHVWERSSATVFAALDTLRARGRLTEGEPTVLIATSHLFKGF
ncbi:PLP-dependent lyase/thiolase [Streptomyces sp. NBC_01478]|uniref:PLP-dependent lyase/thiolase n=1 Tax=Streptomyces sp. NBC_01478 TaxID=2903882 RepID=UPI002E381010|nr:PLP-dependent lyase/thiolase [Streptomyces sp. NBC_01478]